METLDVLHCITEGRGKAREARRARSRPSYLSNIPDYDILLGVHMGWSFEQKRYGDKHNLLINSSLVCSDDILHATTISCRGDGEAKDDDGEHDDKAAEANNATSAK